jgi:predicted cupin superfamily sugar epimerase
MTGTTRSRRSTAAHGEVYHFYLGDPVEMLLLRPDGAGRVLGQLLARRVHS